MTLDELIEKLKGSGPHELYEVYSFIDTLADELKEQHGEIAKLRLLLEHEEIVRTKKLHRVVPAKQNSFLRGSVMKVGDRVFCGVPLMGNSGTIIQTDEAGGRARIDFDSGKKLWKKFSEIHRTQKTA